MTTILDIPGSNPPNAFSTPIQALTSSKHSSTPAPDETATNIVNSVTSSPDPARALWELWDAFFTAVASSSTSHEPLLALLDALHAQPPTQLNVRARFKAERQLSSYIGADGNLHWQTLPRFSAQWRDVHDILEAWRDWDGVRDSGAGDSRTVSTVGSSGGEYFLRFCIFSAALLKATKGKDNGHSIWVFYACRDVLEREGPQSCPPKAHRMSSEQVWALDVRVAAIWMRDGGRALWEADYEGLRRHWAAALDEKTELWPRENGLTRERWLFWGNRLRALSIEGNLDKETVAVVIEAAEVVRGILVGDSNFGY
ncbi:unnamed protein product [Penicillium nalgiovense]|uniref:Uncharacterized protein n=1 Tax=Penicillium nalgiovense TaxID=60175 RepID=A0A9W4MK34_PENNA|nr:unnamed protein product [Penicillium nalgiovense]CAG7970582.1 unnamed protein product [Penicillium nalgiovense]CAG7989144.1 unnamed protein product [Penicillium nalgiovense]CAG7992250.1 unnamed protein product [Penicillium nalgiovense]CAG8029876.1 unnamed protein product [Penicillium nalgiovense]